jgi:hypothetical protein
MGRMLAVSLVFALAAPLLRAQEVSPFEPFSPDQLDNLLAPVALYPDPLLAQVLLAATFPDQIDLAARFVRFDRDPGDVDGQPWDVSVKAVAHYPTVLAMMADKLDWTTAVGQAYVEQSTGVMASIQRLRTQARAAGNLVSTPELEVVDSGGEIELWPAQPEYIYVPLYDPGAVFRYRAPLFFGARFVIGAWLNFDFDWRQHRVFYHGWERGGPSWAERSRPYVHVTTVYVNDAFRAVAVNRTVVDRRTSYGALDRYDDVHRTSTFDNIRSNGRAVSHTPPQTARMTVPNKVIDRNFDASDRRINEYRGRPPQAPAQGRAPEAPGFTPGRGVFDPRETSHRGQSSRASSAPPPSQQTHRNPAPPPARREKDGNDRH